MCCLECRGCPKTGVLRLPSYLPRYVSVGTQVPRSGCICTQGLCLPQTSYHCGGTVQCFSTPSTQPAGGWFHQSRGQSSGSGGASVDRCFTMCRTVRGGEVYQRTWISYWQFRLLFCRCKGNFITKNFKPRKVFYVLWMFLDAAEALLVVYSLNIQSPEWIFSHS